MRNATASGNSLPTDNHSYSPAVPLSLYREVSADLEATKAQLAETNAHNQHLVRENQQLRQEMEKIVQSAYRMQQVLNSLQPFNPSVAPQATTANRGFGVELPRASSRSSTELDANDPFSLAEGDPAHSAYSAPLFTEEQETRPRRGQKPRAADMGGIWLGVAIFLIVVCAFGAGYFVVRPILLKR